MNSTFPPNNDYYNSPEFMKAMYYRFMRGEFNLKMFIKEFGVEEILNTIKKIEQ